MGISIEVWRARIGSYSGAALPSQHSMVHLSMLHDSKIFLLPLAVIVTLLMIGNIEPNPGPVYKCRFCSEEKLTSLSMYISHQSLHSCTSGFMYICPFPTCIQRYTSQQGLNYHFKSFHSEQFNADKQPAAAVASSTWDSVICPYCNIVQNSCHQFCKHFQAHVENGIMVECPLDHICNRGLKYGGAGKDGKKEAVKLGQHLSLYHPGWKTNQDILPPTLPSLQNPTSEFTSSSEVPETPPFSEYQEPSSSSSVRSSDTDVDPDMLYRFFGTFYLMLEADFVLPETQVQGISEQLAVISELLHMQTINNLKKVLSKFTLSDAEVLTIVNEISLSDTFYNVHHKEAPGESLTSEYLRKSYYNRTFTHIDPIEKPLDMDPYGEKVVYVPIKDTLSLLCQDMTVKDQIVKSFDREESNDGIYRDFYNGSVYKKRIMPEKHIDLLVFQDGFAVTNPLGSAKNKHKVIGVYFTIGNLEPSKRSKLKFIHLVSLFNEALLNDEKYGYNCYQPLLDEMKDLETNGIDFYGERVPVFIQFYIGDNLGSHKLGGFVGSFSGKYFCRFCEITRNEFHTDPSSLKPYRSKEDYYKALEELQDLKVQNPELVTHRGVKEESPVNRPDFHVCDPRLPPCLGHDLFEGVVAWDLYHIICHLVSLKWFTLQRLNKIIASFKYSPNDLRNKPAPLIPNSSKLGGHAVQNWCLLRLLPFFLEGCIDDTENPVWKLYLKLKKLVEYACSPAFTNQDIEVFKNLVQEYLIEREILNKRPMPKHHYLAHYPSLISLVGPLIHLWTLRFESKHSFFKNVSRICKNFINVWLTLAKKHQLYLSYICSGMFFSEGITARKELNCKEYEQYVDAEIKSLTVPEDATHYESLTIDEIHYKRGMYLLLGRTGEDDNISVGEIKAMINCGSSTFFVLKVYSAIFSKDYGVHQMDTEKSSMRTVLLSNLKYPVPHPLYELEDKFCLSLKHHLEL